MNADYHPLPWIDILPEFCLPLGCPVWDRERLDRGIVVEGGDSEGTAVWFPGASLGGFVRLYRRSPHDMAPLQDPRPDASDGAPFREEDLRPDLTRPLGLAVAMRELVKDGRAVSELRNRLILRRLDLAGVLVRDPDGDPEAPGIDGCKVPWDHLRQQADDRIAALARGTLAPTEEDCLDLAGALSGACEGPW